MNLLMRRRMMMLQKQSEEDIPIGVELFDYDADDNVYGQYLREADIGSSTMGYVSNARNFTTGFLPFDSQYEFAFTGNSASASALAVLCDENYVVYYKQTAGNMVRNMKQYALTAEAQYGVKLKYLKITCTTDNYNNHAISYKRIS